MENFSDRFRTYREGRGITQRELAERMGISPNYVYLIETGQRVPGPALVKLLEQLERGSVSSVLREDSPSYRVHSEDHTGQPDVASLGEAPSVIVRLTQLIASYKDVPVSYEEMAMREIAACYEDFVKWARARRNARLHGLPSTMKKDEH